MKITQHRKKWVMTKVEKYAKQLGIVLRKWCSHYIRTNGAKDTGTRVLGITGPVQTEDSYIANVTIKGVGNATDSGTFITTYKPSGITTSVGQGIIITSTDGEIATYTAKDLGVANKKGERIYHGIQIFNTNSTGKLSFMDNLVGLYIYIYIYIYI
jgi:hypothetical protein